MKDHGMDKSGLRFITAFIAFFLKDIKCGDLRYGCNYYDYQEGTLVFAAPGQIMEVETDGKVYQPKGYALVFHPDLVHGTTLF